MTAPRVTAVDRHRLLRRFGEPYAYPLLVPREPAGEIPAVAIQDRRVLRGDLGRAGGERRIDEDGQRRRPVLAHEVRQNVQHFLRPSDGERGDDHVAARKRAGEHLRELVVSRRERLVQAIAIRRFDDDRVGLGDRCRIVHHRPARLAEIAGEHDLARDAVDVRPQFHDRRAENVPRVAEAEAQRRRGLEHPVVRHPLQQRQARFRVRDRIQRQIVPRLESRRTARPGVRRPTGRPLPGACLRANSISWMCALSGSITPRRSIVAGVA